MTWTRPWPGLGLSMCRFRPPPWRTTTCPRCSGSSMQFARRCGKRSELDERPCSFCQRLPVDEARRGKVLDGVAHRLVDGDLLGRLASWPGVQEHLAYLGRSIGIHPNQLHAADRRRLEGRRPRLDVEAGRPGQAAVELALGRRE